jgi:hypothetical protein
MVLYFTSLKGEGDVWRRVDGKVVIYSGKDKAENEELLKFAFPCDVW